MQSTAQTPISRLEHVTGTTTSPMAFTLPFHDAADLYLDYIRMERGLSKDTVYGYASWLHNFEKWLTENGYPEPTLDAFNTPVLTRFLHSLHARNLRPRSIRGVFYPLRGMAKESTVFMLHHLNGFSLWEIATSAGISVGAAHKYAAAAQRKLLDYVADLGAPHERSMRANCAVA